MNSSVIFFPSYCLFQDQASGMMIGSAERRNGLYYLVAKSTGSSPNKAVLNVTSNANILLWHRRLGHPSFSYIKLLYSQVFSNKDQVFSCENCTLAKQSWSHQSIQSYKPSKSFHLIHSDIWGPFKHPNISGSRWFITFINFHSRVCWVYLLKEKSEASNIFKRFHKFILNMFQTSIQILRTDNGREY